MAKLATPRKLLVLYASCKPLLAARSQHTLLHASLAQKSCQAQGAGALLHPRSQPGWRGGRRALMLAVVGTCSSQLAFIASLCCQLVTQASHMSREAATASAQRWAAVLAAPLLCWLLAGTAAPMLVLLHFAAAGGEFSPASCPWWLKPPARGSSWLN